MMKGHINIEFDFDTEGKPLLTKYENYLIFCKRQAAHPLIRTFGWRVD